MDSLVPAAMPVPHLAGVTQVITPPTFFQPWLASSAVALATENEYGPSPPLAFCTGGVHRLGGGGGGGRGGGWAGDAARGWVAVAAGNGLDHAFLVDQLLKRLADVQLLERRAELRVVEVDRDVLDAEPVRRAQVEGTAERVDRRQRLVP